MHARSFARFINEEAAIFSNTRGKAGSAGLKETHSGMWTPN